jgi:plastocyanin
MRSGLVLMLMAVLTAGCGTEEGDGGDSSGVRDVTVRSGSFSPTIVAPDTAGDVVWTWNSGGVEHNVTFEDAITGSGDKTTGTFTVNFPNDGTFRYRCTIHSTNFDNGMRGRVVKAGPAPAGEDAPQP